MYSEEPLNPVQTQFLGFSAMHHLHNFWLWHFFIWCFYIEDFQCKCICSCMWRVCR